MKSILASCGAAAALLVCGSASAVDFASTGRIGATFGGYQGEADIKLTDLATNASDSLSQKGDWEPAYGGQLGYTLGMDDFFFDIGLELLQVKFDDDNSEKTDLLLTVGYFLDQNWSLFGGYRRGMQGDGFFNDDTFSENGLFLGVGYGGLQVGPFTLNSSLAYTLSKVDDFPDDGFDFDYGGLSVKLSFVWTEAPRHSLQFRYQRFNGDGSERFDFDNDNVADARFDYELTESYLQLSYLYSFDL